MRTIKESVCPIPCRWVGPLHLRGLGLDTPLDVPLATLESPLWPSVQRGSKVSLAVGGIQLAVQGESMSRSVVVVCPDTLHAHQLKQAVLERLPEVAQVVESGSRFARFQGLHPEIVGRYVYWRLSLNTADASGHNMVTQAAEYFLEWLLRAYPNWAQYVSISANCCADKKVSAVNGLLGRGRAVTAEAFIPEAICQSILKTTPARIADLNRAKNWMGSTLAGSVRSANAHVANMLLAVYLATGQDAANIVEGSQAMTVAEVDSDGSLYFALYLPHVIVGTVGNGKHLPFVQDHLQALGCTAARNSGENATRLAGIIAGVAWCGELSLLAAQTNPGELMRTHRVWERSVPDGDRAS